MLAVVALLARSGPSIQILDPDGLPFAQARVIPFRFVRYSNPQPFPVLVADADGVVDLSGPIHFTPIVGALRKCDHA